MMKLQKPGIAFTAILVFIAAVIGCFLYVKNKRLPVKVLIISKFEIGANGGDYPGEAQYFYEEYLAGGEEYEIAGTRDTNRLYYKNGIAMFLTGRERSMRH